MSMSPWPSRCPSRATADSVCSPSATVADCFHAFSWQLLGASGRVVHPLPQYRRSHCWQRLWCRQQRYYRRHLPLQTPLPSSTIVRSPSSEPDGATARSCSATSHLAGRILHHRSERSRRSKVASSPERYGALCGGSEVTMLMSNCFDFRSW